MSDALSLRDPGMLELGAVLSELVAELHVSLHNRLYAEFLRLQSQGLDAENIAEGLLLFIQHDERHPAYAKLAKALDIMKKFGEEPETHIRTQQTQPINDEILRFRQQHDVDDLLEEFIMDGDRETLPHDYRRDEVSYRRSYPTLVDDSELNEGASSEHETLIPGEISFEEKDS